jgi:hypothetical protein
MATKPRDTSASPFSETDPFNPQNLVSGLIYRDNLRYGDLLIQKINGKICEQYIHATPKFYYPGGVTSPASVQRGGFPAQYDRIKVYDKIDGTNICLFRYCDNQGLKFTSYKTRLTPFLRESKFGNWKLMWQKVSRLYPGAFQELLDDGYYNFGFEMFGSFNKVLVEYDVVLDVRLLYAIDPVTGRIIDPGPWNFPKPGLLLGFGPDVNPDDKHAEVLAQYEQDFAEGKPIEGVMFFVISGFYANAFKCKPPAVVSLQAENSGGPQRIGYRDAYTTAVNAMESARGDANLQQETYKLLAEEWPPDVINLSTDVINEAIRDAKQEVQFRAYVLELFRDSGFTWSIENKGPIMRHMMQYFPKSDAKKVFSILSNYHAIFH